MLQDLPCSADTYVSVGRSLKNVSNYDFSEVVVQLLDKVNRIPLEEIHPSFIARFISLIKMYRPDMAEDIRKEFFQRARHVLERDFDTTSCKIFTFSTQDLLTYLIILI